MYIYMSNYDSSKLKCFKSWSLTTQAWFVVRSKNKMVCYFKFVGIRALAKGNSILYYPKVFLSDQLFSLVVSGPIFCSFCTLQLCDRHALPLFDTYQFTRHLLTAKHDRHLRDRFRANVFQQVHAGSLCFHFFTELIQSIHI